MEQTAASAETEALLPAGKYAIFTEKRTNSIRMNDALPISWLHRDNRTTVTDTVEADEYYPFQVGVYASGEQGVIVEAYSITPSLLAKAFNCFNLGGIRFNGTEFNQSMRVNSSHVGAVWFGADASAATDSYLNATLHLTLTVAGVKHVEDVAVSLAVAPGAAIQSKGDVDPVSTHNLPLLVCFLDLFSQIPVITVEAVSFEVAGLDGRPRPQRLCRVHSN
jgi:hypothetical protein